jgi:hypothetical protein
MSGSRSRWPRFWLGLFGRLYGTRGGGRRRLDLRYRLGTRRLGYGCRSRFHERRLGVSRFFDSRGRGTRAVAARQTPPDFQGHIVVERARMRFLVADAKLGQEVQNHVGLDLQLTGQFVNANFTHRVTPCRVVHPRQGLRRLASPKHPEFMPLDAPCFLS